ncbi:MAG: hypothetical protein LBL79_15120 [Prevotella sp.]|jgi:hypothetical protein|nr:hypothetical protein [Prevotella sp.]
MQTPNEHISLLTDLLPRYRSVNTLYTEIAERLTLSFDAQYCITDFYTEFHDVLAFEKAVMNTLLSTDNEKLTLIISNLRTEIHKNINVYTANKDFFDGIDTINICAKRHNPLKIEIDGQLKNTNKLWKELTQVRNSLESASWQDDKIATQRLTKEEERLEQTYKKEQEKLKILYEQQKESDNHASKYLENVFRRIYELGCSFISLLNNYFPIEKENIPVSITEISEPEQELQIEIEPDTIFRTDKYKNLLILEQKLITDKYLNSELHWISIHENGKPDIKRLVTFLVALMDNKYFLPRKDPKIKTFFESRYHISIGQNFERKRREPLLNEYKAVFYDYPF